MTSKIKTTFQYSIYPVFMLSAFFFILLGIQSGINQYVTTISVILVYGFIILMLEKILPFEKDWLNGNDWNLDLTYYIINYTIKTIAQISFIWIASYLQLFNWFPVSLPFGVQVIIALTLIDFFLFYVHWISHKYEWLWKLHAIHHSSERLYFLNGEKRHALHQILEGLPGVFLCLIIGAPQEVVVAALALLAINMMMQHTNLDYKAGVLKHFFCVAELHRWHHRADYEDAQVNFGAWLTIWDKIFKTNFDSENIMGREDIGEIGIKEEPNFPKSYLKQVLYPFSSRIQKKAKETGLLLILLSISTTVFSQTDTDNIIGKWTKDKSSLTVEVFKKEKTYSVKITDAEEKIQINKIIIWNLEYDSKNNEWNNGELQLPDMTHSVSCYIKMKDKNTLKITGYHGLKIFGSSEIYHKKK
uniref:sterol desaturase family protein n=1 Tax=Flavobacterium sp. TaxID=239 RepID=UPI00404B96B7